MATYNSAQENVAAFLEDRKPRKKLAAIIVDKERLPGGDCPALYSYGSHFPLILNCGDIMYVNIDTYSRTTSRHQRAVEIELKAHGWYRLASTITHKKYTFAAYQNKSTLMQHPYWATALTQSIGS